MAQNVNAVSADSWGLTRVIRLVRSIGDEGNGLRLDVPVIGCKLVRWQRRAILRDICACL